MAQRTRRVGKDAADFGMALALLVKYFNMPEGYMDVHRVRVYERGLEPVSGALLMEAALRATQTRTFFPKVNELLADAEACRRELIAAHPYTGCADCEDQRGWREVTIEGVKKMERCPCRTRYAAKLAQLGVSTGSLALPPASPQDWTEVGSME